MADTREKIRLAASRLFISKGFSKTTIGQIESAAGLAPRAGSFYRHFKSKQELLIEIARTEISETPAEFDFDQISALENTRAELVTIAQIYEQASQRQKPYLALIDEVRRTRIGKRMESKLNQQMLDALIGWIKKKAAASSLPPAQIASLVIMVFGGWLFCLIKSQQDVVVDQLDRDQMLKHWADFWAAELDRPATKKR